MKRTFIIALCVCLVLAGAGCEETREEEASTPPAQQIARDTVKQPPRHQHEQNSANAAGNRASANPPAPTGPLPETTSSPAPTPVASMRSDPIHVDSLGKASAHCELYVNGIPCSYVLGRSVDDLLGEYGGGETSFRINPYTGEFENVVVLRNLGGSVSCYGDNVATSMTVPASAVTRTGMDMALRLDLLTMLLGSQYEIKREADSEEGPMYVWECDRYRVYAEYPEGGAEPASTITIVDTTLPYVDRAGFTG